MFEPAIPYLHLPELVLIPSRLFGAFPEEPLSIKPFGTLVAAGVYLGAALAMRRGRRLGLDERALASFVAWVVGFGFVGGHVLDLVFYYPERLLADPLALVRLWDGLSSFGGFTGAVIGAIAWRVRHATDILPYADTVASALPLGWVFGRAGCSVAHDHPGLPSDAWFAVQYPGGGRFDLGLYEMLLTIPIALAFYWLGKRRRPWGFFAATLCLSYAPLRFALDFLRERTGADVTGAIDVRYGGLTPAQWGCFLLLLLGAVLLRDVLARVARGEGFEEPRVPEAFTAPSGTVTSDAKP